MVDVLRWWDVVNPLTLEEDKVNPLVKRVAEDTFTFLVLKEVKTFEKHLNPRRYFEAWRRKRLSSSKYERLPNSNTIPAITGNHDDLDAVVTLTTNRVFQTLMPIPATARFVHCPATHSRTKSKGC